MLEVLQYSPLIAIFSIVFCWILTDEDMILELPYLWLRSKLEKYSFIWLPLFGCPKCNAGQIAFWSYLFFDHYLWYEHIYFVTTTIFLTWLLMNIYKKLNYE